MSSYAVGDSVQIEFKISSSYADSNLTLLVTKGVTTQRAERASSTVTDGVKYVRFTVLLDKGNGCYSYSLYNDSLSNMNGNDYASSNKLREGTIRRVSLASHIIT